MRLIKHYFFPFFLLFMILSEPIFNCYMALRGIVIVGGMLQWLYVGIFIVSIFLYILKTEKHQNGFDSKRVLIPMSIILVLYWSTHFFYTLNSQPLYTSYLLAFGVKCVPAAIIGMHFIKYPCMNRVDRLIPFFVLPVGFIIGTIGFRHASMNQMLADSDDASNGGLNYQSLSYYMAELYSYSAYFVFFSSIKSTVYHKFFRWIMLFAMMFFAAVCLLSGGRGAMVFIVAVTIFIIYLLFKNNRMSKLSIFLIVLGIALIFTYVFVTLDIGNSVGFTRVLNSMTHDEARDDLRSKAIISFWDSPIIGHGVGSIWWEVGFFSHNVFQDILVEGGIIGLVIFIVYVKKIYQRMIKLCIHDSSYIFLMLMFVKESMVTMFSGYWFSAYPLWMVFGITMYMSKYKYMELSSKV